MSLLRAPLLALGFGVLAFGQTPAPSNKVGIINIQQAIVQTKDGQKAAAELDAKYQPKRKDVDRQQSELQTMETQYRSGVNTMSDEAKQKLARDIDQRRKQIQRLMDDGQAELEQDQQRMLQQLGQKMMAVIDRYAADHGYVLVLDVSSPQTPVLFASNTIDITKDIIELYDKAQGTTAAAPATGAVPRPAPAAAKPAPKPAAPAK